MEKLVGKKYQYTGLKIGKVEVLSEPRVGFYLKKDGNPSTEKSCRVLCSCGSKHEVLLRLVSNDVVSKCPVCKKGGAKVIQRRIKSLFEHFMLLWEPETHKPDTYKLPYFKGGVGEEYIAGFCYVDKNMYDECSKVMCVKPKCYILYNKSKDNCERLGIPYKGCKGNNYIFVHREAITCLSEAADHINGIKLDNRSVNIREATHADNSYNKGILESNTSGYTGVIFEERKKPWRAQITKNKKSISKAFTTIEDAIEYRDCLSLHCFGEFAKLNKPDLIEYYKDNLFNILDTGHHTWQPF